MYLALMKEKVVIQICLGSSCFSRGNGKTLKVIQNYLKEHHLEGDVVLRGNHCFSDCSKGPIVKINDELHEFVNSDSILELLQQTFNK
ncbi:MAG: NAD(P)H-dependent oxidoreductase subunit E [Bacteroidales bacterium]|nr:NAD(P)H-dependent oxidoreductase subunit E [Bacteroidales bacterium]